MEDKSIQSDSNHISSNVSVKSRGSKEEVFNGLALKTSGGLTKDQLIQNSKGKVVSKAKHELGKKAFAFHKKKPEENHIISQQEDEEEEKNKDESEPEQKQDIPQQKEIKSEQGGILLNPDAIQEFKSDSAEQKLNEIPKEEEDDIMKDIPANASCYENVVIKKRAPRAKKLKQKEPKQ
jgi:hypothetical protein